MAEKRRLTMPRPWLNGWTVNVDWNTAAVEVDRRQAFIVSLDAGKQTQMKLLWHGTRIGTAAKLKPSCLRVPLPPVLLEMKLEEQHGPFVYRKDASLSRWKDEFDSHTGH